MTLSEQAFDHKVIHKIRDYFLEKKETLSAAESVTSGLMQTALALAPDASRFYQGGITAYNLGQKYKHLSVEPISAENCNCVSQDVARQMALSVCGLFSSEWGIGITGYSIPVTESGNKLFAFYSISYKNKIVLHKKITSTKEEIFEVQRGYVNAILKDLLKLLTAKK